jgi:hypothetical protein
MGQLARVAFAALAAVLVSGCGTICNFAGGYLHPDKAPTVYGGFRFDMEVLEAATTTHESLNITHGSGYTVLFVLGVLCADPVLSLAADTLTLPITLYLEERRARAHARDHDGAGDSAATGGPQAHREVWSSANPAPQRMEPGGPGPVAPIAVPSGPTTPPPAPRVRISGQIFQDYLWGLPAPNVPDPADVTTAPKS